MAKVLSRLWKHNNNTVWKLDSSAVKKREWSPEPEHDQCKVCEIIDLLQVDPSKVLDRAEQSPKKPAWRAPFFQGEGRNLKEGISKARKGGAAAKRATMSHGPTQRVKKKKKKKKRILRKSGRPRLYSFIIPMIIRKVQKWIPFYAKNELKEWKYHHNLVTV